MHWAKCLLTGFIATSAFLVVSSTVQADQIDNYTLEGVTLQDGATATGSFTFDFTTDTFTQVAIDFSTPSGSSFGPVDAFTTADLDAAIGGTGFAPDGSPAGPYDEFELNNSVNFLYLDLYNPGASPGMNPLVPGTISPYGASDLGFDCTATGEFPGCDSEDAVTAGSLLATPIVVATPELSTLFLVLMGCGLMGFYGLRRRNLDRLPSTI